MPYCEYCGEEVESDDFDLDRYDHKHFICNQHSCHRGFYQDCRAESDENRRRAEDDDYSRY